VTVDRQDLTQKLSNSPRQRSVLALLAVLTVSHRTATSSLMMFSAVSDAVSSETSSSVQDETDQKLTRNCQENNQEGHSAVAALFFLTSISHGTDVPAVVRQSVSSDC